MIKRRYGKLNGVFETQLVNRISHKQAVVLRFSLDVLNNIM